MEPLGTAKCTYPGCENRLIEGGKFVFGIDRDADKVVFGIDRDACKFCIDHTQLCSPRVYRINPRPDWAGDKPQPGEDFKVIAQRAREAALIFVEAVLLRDKKDRSGRLLPGEGNEASTTPHHKTPAPQKPSSGLKSKVTPVPIKQASKVKKAPVYKALNKGDPIRCCVCDARFTPGKVFRELYCSKRCYNENV